MSGRLVNTRSSTEFMGVNGPPDPPELSPGDSGSSYIIGVGDKACLWSVLAVGVDGLPMI